MSRTQAFALRLLGASLLGSMLGLVIVGPAVVEYVVLVGWFHSAEI